MVINKFSLSISKSHTHLRVENDIPKNDFPLKRSV